MSCHTCICPSQYGPAPIPIVGIEIDSVILFANLLGINSRIIPDTPASSRALASFNNSVASILF